MSIVASRRKFAKQVRSIKGKQGNAAAANIIGEEIDDLLGAYAVKTAPTKDKNKNIETGAKEAGVELEELNLGIFDKNDEGKKTRNKSFFKNWSQKLNFSERDEATYKNEEGRTYNTEELQSIGRIRNSESPRVTESLLGMKQSGTKLSSLYGTPSPVDNVEENTAVESATEAIKGGIKEGTTENVQELMNNKLKFSPTLNKPLSSIMNTEEFENASALDRKTMLNESPNNDINASPADTENFEIGDEIDPNNTYGHPWGGASSGSPSSFKNQSLGGFR
tara:strand:+ start:476 stop:1312 length:837 start_codon:yes stop_codon:yes gene_type:complete